VSGFDPVLPLRISHFKAFLKLTHSASVTFVQKHINESGHEEWLERRKVK